MPNIAHLFNNTVNTQRAVESQDSMFSNVQTFEYSITGLKCRIQQEIGFEPVEGGRKFTKTSHVLYCAADTDLIMKDIVIFNDQAYNVVDDKIEGNASTYLKVTLERSDADWLCYPIEGTEWQQIAEYDGTPERLGTVDKLLEYSVDGQLYGCSSGTGELLRWDGVDTWDVVATQYLTENYINDLVELNGEIYGSGQKTDGKGLLLKWNGTDAWILMAERELLANDFLSKLAVYNGKIYAGTLRESELWEWDGVSEWILKVADPTPTGSRGIISMIVFEGSLFAGTDVGLLYRFDDVDTWDWVTGAGEANDVNDLAIYNGELYAVTQFGGAYLIKWNGTDAWITLTVENAHGQNAFKCMVVFEDDIYVSSSTDNYLLKWDKSDNFTIVASNIIPTNLGSMVDLFVYQCRILGTLGGITNNYVVYAWDK